MPPFPGALPPSLMGGPPNAGAAVAPHGNPGATAGGLSDLKIALEKLQAALPTLPMGTELHKAVLDAVGKISKHMTETQDSPQMKMQNLLAMVQKMKQQQPNAALGAMAGPAGGPAGGQPPLPPTLPPPPAPPPGMAGAA